jgi:hypothetical protein
MADRLVDIALFVSARAWVGVVALTLIGAVHLASALAATPTTKDTHPERVVVRLS